MSDATSEFRDVLARVITEAVDEVVHTDMALFSDEGCADDILATPEMQAIRRALRVAADVGSSLDPRPVTPRDWLRGVMGLPASVIEWVLAEDGGR